MAAANRPASYGPSVALFVVGAVGLSLAGSWALEGIRNDESSVFVLLGRVAGLPMAGVTVVSPGGLLVARLAGLLMVARFVGVLLVRKSLRRSGSRDLG